VSLRGAVSIARRLQDPLAELVKIDPKSIGVGQYQHDVNQPRLKQRLDEIVESCVNRVGVEVNTASAALLAYVAGIGPGLAQSIVALRDSAADSSRAPICASRAAPGRQGLRAGRRIPARARRPTSARRQRRSPRALRAGGTHGERPGRRRAPRWSATMRWSAPSNCRAT
jgi:hypothetical protein